MNNDLISREALKSELTRLGWTEENGFKNRYVLDDIINNVQSVDAIVNTIEVRPQGKWIDHTATQNLLWGQLECPFCHKRSNRGASYCQYCGARLEETEENA